MSSLHIMRPCVSISMREHDASQKSSFLRLSSSSMVLCSSQLCYMVRTYGPVSLSEPIVGPLWAGMILRNVEGESKSGTKALRKTKPFGHPLHLAPRPSVPVIIIALWQHSPVRLDGLRNQQHGPVELPPLIPGSGSEPQNKTARLPPSRYRWPPT